MTYTSVYKLLSKLRRDLRFDFEETDAIEWAGEALLAIGAVQQWEEAVSFIEVKNHKALLPTGMINLIQVARNNCFEVDPTCPVTVPPSTTTVTTCGSCSTTTSVYSPYFTIDQYAYGPWTDSKYYGSCYTPVRLKDHTFFASVVCKEVDQAIYDGCRDEYSINDPYIVLSFKEGQIAISYTKQKLDDNGYPLIPDNYSYREAITRYVRYKVSLMKFDSREQGSLTYLQKAESDWHWYCQQAKNTAKMPTIDDYQDLLEQRSYLLPHVHHYYGFFGRLNEPEDRPWNRPYESYAVSEFVGDVPVSTSVSVTLGDSVSVPNVPSSGSIVAPVTVTVAGSGSYTVPGGKLLHFMVAEATATSVVKLGTTGGGSDLVDGTVTSSAAETFSIGLYFAATTTIYFTGTYTAKLYFL